MLLAAALAAGHERALVDTRGIALAVTIYLLSAFLLWRGLPWHRRPDGVAHARFGAANVVTSLRLSLVIWLLACATADAYSAPGAGVILVMMGVEDVVEFPAALVDRVPDGLGVRAVYRCGEPRVRVVDQVSIVVPEAGELMDLECGHDCLTSL